MIFNGPTAYVDYLDGLKPILPPKQFLPFKNAQSTYDKPEHAYHKLDSLFRSEKENEKPMMVSPAILHVAKGVAAPKLMISLALLTFRDHPLKGVKYEALAAATNPFSLSDHHSNKILIENMSEDVPNLATDIAAPFESPKM